MIKHYFMMAAIGCLAGIGAAQAMAEAPHLSADKKMEIASQGNTQAGWAKEENVQNTWGSHPPVPFLKSTAELASLLAIKPEHKPDISMR